MWGLPTSVLLILSFMGTVTVYVTDGLVAKKISKTTTDFYFFLMVKGILCGLLILAAMGGFGQTSLFSVGTGAVFGALCMLQTFSSLKAMETGPFSYTQVIVALSTVIPTFCGLFWGEAISFAQYIGIALMIVCIAFSTEKSEADSGKKASFKWLLLSIGSSVMCGFMGVMQKLHQTSEHASELPSFLVVCFIVWSLISAILFIKNAVRKDSPASKLSFRFQFSHIILIVLASIALMLCHIINLFLSGEIPAAVLFPIINICPLILTTVAGLVLFREKISPKRWFGIAIGIVSMLFVGGVITF